LAFIRLDCADEVAEMAPGVIDGSLLGLPHRCDRLTAPCVFDGPINGECFRAYVNQQLIPTLKPGDIVILDNLGSHKSKAVRDAVKGAGARKIRDARF
jgi:hypothetical protein